jgi:hypothetical protein
VKAFSITELFFSRTPCTGVDELSIEVSEHLVMTEERCVFFNGVL